MIAEFVTALVSVFSGLTQGFATAFVDGANTLLVTSDGKLTTFASWGIIILGVGIITGVVRWVAGKVGRIGH